MTAKVNFKKTLAFEIDEKYLVERKELEENMSKLFKLNKDLIDINLKNIKIIYKQNERFKRMNKKIDTMRKKLINEWGKTLDIKNK